MNENLQGIKEIILPITENTNGGGDGETLTHKQVRRIARLMLALLYRELIEDRMLRCWVKALASPGISHRDRNYCAKEIIWRIDAIERERIEAGGSIFSLDDDEF